MYLFYTGNRHLSNGEIDRGDVKHDCWNEILIVSKRT